MYQVRNPADRAAGSMGQASNSYSAMTREQKINPPPKTAGGAIGSAGGGAMAGAMMGAQMGSAGGPWGAVIGAGVGAASYLFS